MNNFKWYMTGYYGGRRGVIEWNIPLIEAQNYCRRNGLRIDFDEKINIVDRINFYSICRKDNIHLDLRVRDKIIGKVVDTKDIFGIRHVIVEHTKTESIYEH